MALSNFGQQACGLVEMPLARHWAPPRWLASSARGTTVSAAGGIRKYRPLSPPRAATLTLSTLSARTTNTPGLLADLTSTPGSKTGWGAGPIGTPEVDVIVML